MKEITKSAYRQITTIYNYFAVTSDTPSLLGFEVCFLYNYQSFLHFPQEKQTWPRKSKRYVEYVRCNSKFRFVVLNLFLIFVDAVLLNFFRVTWTCLCAHSVHGWETQKDALEQLVCPVRPIRSNPIQANRTRLPKMKFCVRQCLELQCASEAVANLFASSFLEVEDSCRRKLHRNLQIWWLNRLHGVSKSSKCRVAKSQTPPCLIRHGLGPKPPSTVCDRLKVELYIVKSEQLSTFQDLSLLSPSP